MREIDNILNFTDFKKAVNKLDEMAQTDPSKIKINFPKTENNSWDLLDKFFKYADGNPDQYC